MMYATQGGFWLTASKAIGFFSSLLVATAMANLIPPAVFGFYRFVVSGAGIIGAFSLAGIGAAITQAVARGYEGTFVEATRKYFIWSIAMVALALGTAAYYASNENYALAISFCIVAALNPILTSSTFFGQFISGKKDFKTFAIYEALRAVIPSAALILVLFFTDSALIILFVYFFASTAVAMVLHYRTLWKYKPNDLVDNDAISYGKHLSAMGIMGKVAEHVDKILVFHYLGAAQLALYAFASTPINQLKTLNDIPAKLALPKMSQRDLGSLKDTLPAKIGKMVGLMVLIVIAYIIIAPIFFHLLFPQYVEAILFSQVLAISLVFAPGSLFREALTAHMKTRELYISQIVLPIIKIVMYAVLLPIFGIWGAIWTIVVSQFLMFVLHAILFLRARYSRAS